MTVSRADFAHLSQRYVFFSRNSQQDYGTTKATVAGNMTDQHKHQTPTKAASIYVDSMVLEHKKAGNALFAEKQFFEASEKYQEAINIANSQLEAVQNLKQNLALNRARALFQHATCAGKVDKKSASPDKTDKPRGADPAERQRLLKLSLKDALVAAELNPGDAKTQYILGRIALELNNRKLARETLRKAQKLDPDVIRNKKVVRFLTRKGNTVETQDSTSDSLTTNTSTQGWLGTQVLSTPCVRAYVRMYACTHAHPRLNAL